MSSERLERLLKGEVATAMARAALQSGDRLYIQRCGGIRSTVTYRGDWWGCWIVTASLDDIHALHILRVNGKPRVFAEEAAAFLDQLHPDTRKALLKDCQRRSLAREAEHQRILASAEDNDDEVPW